MTSFAPAAPDQRHSEFANHAALPSSDFTGMLPAKQFTDLPGKGSSPGEEEPIDITLAQKMISATAGSLLTGLLVTPLDVVRVRLQSQDIRQPTLAAHKPLPAAAEAAQSTFRPPNLGVTACCREVFFMNNTAEYCAVGPRIDSLAGGSNSAGSTVECAVEQTQRRTFNSTFDGLRKIARNEGVTTLWRGLSPTLLMAIPANVIYFSGYEWLRYDRQSPIFKAVREEYAPLAAGAAARTVAAAFVSPIELFKTRLQASHGSSAAGHLADTFHSIREMVGTSGYRSLWRGLTLTLWRDVPFSAMYWWGYETVRGRLIDARERHSGRTLESDGPRGRARRRSQSRENHTHTFIDSFTAGAVSGALASIATTPFDVGKTRTQVFRDANKGVSRAVEKATNAAAAPEERTMIQLLWHIFRTDGVPGIFKGWIPRTLKVAPACAIMISSYEVGKKVFRGVNEKALEK